VNVVLFSHSALSDWNHGNAHFQRGVISALQADGHRVNVFESRDAWSVVNVVAEYGETCLAATQEAYPDLTVRRYSAPLDLDEALADADLVLVHEWNPHDLVAAIGEHRARNPRYVLFFHDTHHRSVSDPASMAGYDLSAYDGVLAFGDVIRRRYLEGGWARQVWTWHEAADTRVFHPHPEIRRSRDLVWIGNWGDEERTEELHEFLIEPVRTLGLTATVYGVRYPPAALSALAAAGIEYRGWLPNYRVPQVFAGHRVTVHVPRRPYSRQLPGIPTIRPFEAMACGIPLVSAPWEDSEGLFAPGDDYLVAPTGEDMTRQLDAVMTNQALASSLAHRGVAAIRRRHTCGHRVQELLAIVNRVNASRQAHGLEVSA
jgi:spore maturation protein CgeB